MMITAAKVGEEPYWTLALDAVEYAVIEADECGDRCEMAAITVPLP